MVGIEQDDPLGAAFGDVLVLALLRVCQIVVLVEERPGID